MSSRLRLSTSADSARRFARIRELREQRENAVRRNDVLRNLVLEVLSHYRAPRPFVALRADVAAEYSVIAPTGAAVMGHLEFLAALHVCRRRGDVAKHPDGGYVLASRRVARTA